MPADKSIKDGSSRIKQRRPRQRWRGRKELLQLFHSCTAVPVATGASTQLPLLLAIFVTLTFSGIVALLIDVGLILWSDQHWTTQWFSIIGPHRRFPERDDVPDDVFDRDTHPQFRNSIGTSPEVVPPAIPRAVFFLIHIHSDFPENSLVIVQEQLKQLSMSFAATEPGLLRSSKEIRDESRKGSRASNAQQNRLSVYYNTFGLENFFNDTGTCYKDGNTAASMSNSYEYAPFTSWTRNIQIQYLKKTVGRLSICGVLG
jgi:hypothetical protein